MTNLEHALKYASIGWHVFPLVPDHKIPLAGSSGFNDATTDQERIKQMWERTPKANIGVWAKTVMCLDIDRKNEKDGFLWLGAQEDLPTTVCQTTPSGSSHFIFKMPDIHIKSSGDAIADGVDIRANDGYFVVYPSSLSKTNKYVYEGVYEWIEGQSPFDIEPAALPEWLINKIIEVTPTPIDAQKNNDEDDLINIKTVVDAYPALKQMKCVGGVLRGSHPIHGSDGGQNFKIDLNNGYWSCYRHKNEDTGNFIGGYSLWLIALMEGIVPCKEFKKGCLTGEKFKKVLDVIQNKFGISPDLMKNGQLERLLPAIDDIKTLSPEWKRAKAIDELCPKIAKLSPIDRQAFLNALKSSLNLSRDDLTAIKQSIKKSAKKSSKFDETWDTDESGNITNTDRNVLNILKTDKELIGCFRRNTFSEELDVCKNGLWEKKNEIVPRPINDDDDYQVKTYILNHYNIECRINQISECVTHIGIENNYNPVLDYLDSLEWDGVPRLATWMTKFFGVEDNDYYRHVSQMFFISAVRRAKSPGCQYDHVICLAGGQGIFKSTLIKMLADPWYLPIHLKDSMKDTIQKMQGAWFLEIPEGVSFSNKDIEEMKAFITETFNRERFAYGRRVGRYNRKSVFVITINPKTIGYLADPTGNRRFVPVTIKNDINLKEVLSIKDQLFAEACIINQTDFKCWIDKNDETIMDGYNKEMNMAEVQDDWADVILEWIASGTMLSKTRVDGRGDRFSETLKTRVSCIDVWVSALRGDIKTYSQYREGRRIGEIMRRLGCEMHPGRDSSGPVKKFDISHLIVPVDRQAEEVAKFSDESWE